MNSHDPGHSRRILHCIPTLGCGGAERQLTFLARGLRRHGWDVHVAYLHGGPFLESLEAGGIALHPLGGPGGTIRSMGDPRLPAAMVTLGRSLRPDVLHTWMGMMDIWGAAASRFFSTRWVIAERTSEVFYQTAPRRYRLRRSLGRFASAVISNSALGDAYWKRALPRLKVHRFMISNGIDIQSIEEASDRPLGAEDIRPGRKVVLHAGRFEVEKNLPVLLEALRRVSEEQDVQVVFCGGGRLIPEAKRIVASFSTAGAGGLGKKFSFLGSVSDIYSWMKRADVMISASFFEGHPNAILEAMAAGCPLVVSDIPGHRALLNSDRAILAPSDRPEILAAGVASVLSSPGPARIRAAEAKKQVERFSLAEMVRRYDHAYRIIMGERS